MFLPGWCIIIHIWSTGSRCETLSTSFHFSLHVVLSRLSRSLCSQERLSSLNSEGSPVRAVTPWADVQKTERKGSRPARRVADDGLSNICSDALLGTEAAWSQRCAVCLRWKGQIHLCRQKNRKKSKLGSRWAIVLLSSPLNLTQFSASTRFTESRMEFPNLEVGKFPATFGFECVSFWIHPSPERVVVNPRCCRLTVWKENWVLLLQLALGWIRYCLIGSQEVVRACNYLLAAPPFSH